MGKERTTGKPQSYATKGDFARGLRDKLGLGQADAAQKWRLSERTIRDVEAGRGASAATLRTLAEALRLPNWHDLLTDEEQAQLGVGQTPPDLPDDTSRIVR